MSAPGKRNSRDTANGLVSTAYTWGRRIITGGIVLLFAVLWVAAFGWNVNELRKGALAANGHYGRAGTVTVLGSQGLSRSRFCAGEFRSLDTSIVVTGVEVRKSGGCVPGVQKPARLVRANGTGLFVSDGRDVAWTPGATGWFSHVLLSLLFGAPVLLIVYAVARSLLRRRSAGAESASPTDGRAP